SLACVGVRVRGARVDASTGPRVRAREREGFKSSGRACFASARSWLGWGLVEQPSALRRLGAGRRGRGGVVVGAGSRAEQVEGQLGCRVAELLERLCLELADAFARDAELPADLLEGLWVAAGESEAAFEDVAEARLEPS